MVRNAVSGAKTMLGDKITILGVVVFTSLIVLALIGPMITPYPYDKLNYSEDGSLERLEGPSLDHPLGTTQRGYDVLSRVIYGARPTMYAAIVGGLIAVSLGTTIGVTAGFMGGNVETVLMRINDFMYGVPLIPFAIVLITFFGASFTASILVISLIYWRVSSRVLRSQVLQIKERPFIESARASGASTPRIIFKHVLPNIANMVILWFALSAGYVVLYQAGLAFLGVVSPFNPSWGVMIRNAYKAGFVYDAWWWSLPPGFLISATVLSAFLVGHGYENISSEKESM
jgi:peptide/nickel transport system permease protein